MNKHTFTIKEGAEFVELKNLLKILNLVNSGGEAKVIIQNGEVTLNGQVETRRGKKLYDGDVIRLGEDEVVIEKG